MAILAEAGSGFVEAVPCDKGLLAGPWLTNGKSTLVLQARLFHFLCVNAIATGAQQATLRSSYTSTAAAQQMLDSMSYIVMRAMQLCKLAVIS